MVLPIYGDAIRANKIGSFVMGGETFHIIRPGYCIQGKRRQAWTQFVHDGIPVYETKVKSDMAQSIAQFERLWAKHIGADRDLLSKALSRCKDERRRKFRDGESGETPAPAMRDGRSEGKRYPS